MFQFICPPMPHFIVGGEDTYAAGAGHPDRSGIGVFDLLAVTRGGLHLEEDGVSYPVPSGHYLILRPDRAHRTRQPCTEETHFYWIHFQTVGEWSDGAERPAPLPSQAGQEYVQIEPFAISLPRTGGTQAPETLHGHIRGLLALQRDSSPPAKWRAQQAFHELLGQLQQQAGSAAADPYQAVADETADFLRRHYQEPVSYKRLAEALHFHPNYIALCMKRVFGCTPLDYLTRYRVEQAKQLLVRTNEPIGAIAENAGFGSFPYFTRCFVRHTGITPKSFRLHYRESGRFGK